MIPSVPCNHQVLPFVATDCLSPQDTYEQPGVMLHLLLQTDYQGRRMHPSVKLYLTQYFKSSNSLLYSLLHRDFQWADLEQ